MTATDIQQSAEELAGPFPDLMVRAEHLAQTVILGTHGRRRAGVGDDFWQYRQMHAGDSYRSVDWRRSARSDTQYVREREWQISQTVFLWVNRAASMRFSSMPGLPTKAERARVLGLAASILLARGGERVGLIGDDIGPASGRQQVAAIAQALVTDSDGDYSDFGRINATPRASILLFSDFFGDLSSLRRTVETAANRGSKGVLIQILDPAEEAFPFRGRAIFESVGRTLSHETMKANDLKDRYLERLAELKNDLSRLCRDTGWQYHCHHTEQNAQSALLWLYSALNRGQT